ncbi:RNA polymerase sigma factor [Lacimicrobium alkaliphilum]|uniref:RNA polymerase sigma-70 region 2 domain-containing protein n=1 Tax=Lacimicrobium alkaliphilum TaxID=1526571 RepID=A0ABQ1RP20_9ALTE|nr:sigma-70 family RNA polymerase sigma factor [Lacimicrobium alkaliphilum]GGD73344.1 hypothetical protein GCM10011357_30540 [Lacimicrobium alkaliphilum]
MQSRFLSRLYKSYWQELCDRLRARYGLGPPEPEDIAQQAFLKYSQNLTKEPIKNPRAYLYTLARNLYVDHYRSQSRQERLIDEILVEEGCDPVVTVCTETLALQSEMIDVLDHAARQLPLKHQQLLRASRFDGLSYQQISRLSGYSVTDISRCLERVHLTLQNALEHWQQGNSQSPEEPEKAHATSK